jgi:hypothetical protein
MYTTRSTCKRHHPNHRASVTVGCYGCSCISRAGVLQASDRIDNPVLISPRPFCSLFTTIVPLAATTSYFLLFSSDLVSEPLVFRLLAAAFRISMG